MKHPQFSLCVYCGSKPGVLDDYAQAAFQTGRWIGEHGGQLIYGGGSNGLMGVVAKSTLEAGGTVIGVIPQALVDKEWALYDCTELHIVANMHERKAMMAELADAFLILPGGIGTFEEFFEVWTWKQLEYHSKPIGVLNVANYYTPFMELIDHCTQQGFMGHWQSRLIRIDPNWGSLLPQLIQDAGFATGERLGLI